MHPILITFSIISSVRLLSSFLILLYFLLCIFYFCIFFIFVYFLSLCIFYLIFSIFYIWNANTTLCKQYCNGNAISKRNLLYINARQFFLVTNDKSNKRKRFWQDVLLRVSRDISFERWEYVDALLYIMHCKWCTWKETRKTPLVFEILASRKIVFIIRRSDKS